MKVGPAKIIEHANTDLRIILERTGEELRRFNDRRSAESYVRGWNQWEKKS